MRLRWAICGCSIALLAGFSSSTSGQSVDPSGKLASPPLYATASQASSDKIQQLIDEANEGDTIVIAPGEYVGKIEVNKRITLRGDPGAKLIHDDASPAVRITAEGVRLSGLTIEQRSLEESAAVELAASRVTLDHLDVITHTFGIRLRESDHNQILDNKITWLTDADTKKVKTSIKRNGIDLFDSHYNDIRANQISSMSDGIYMESSHHNTVSDNKIEHSRYGIHCMYTEGTIVRSNIGTYNVTGAMIMGVMDAVVENNSFTKQSENVNSQGLLLFDVHSSRISGNNVEGNRVGFYIEESSDNSIRDNRITRNFVGVQLLESKENELTGNDFIANVINAEAISSTNNRLSGNFWDTFDGIDTDGDGHSNIAYAINPFFQQMTSRTPPFQLFFQSPGMLFLEELMETGKSTWTTDKAPLMKPSGTVADSHRVNYNSVIASLLMLAISLLTIYNAGVKRT
ncbi:right-handed parallel beta-helix repeat-containing protein [Paenibacillus xylaniclasticus]|uniref:right-handed parallel beta-helix repeat-containing protein n=1 Tax=Paenibacillus xylaniclasticus TaxID=588083 RepID=UPI0013DE8430|nr:MULTISPECIES: NosD domain-containing protein [Paenibacillus]